MDANDPQDLLLPFESGPSSRRSFLRLVGFGVAGAAVSGCSRGPMRKVVPALIGVESIVPGRAYWIATTCGGCSAGCGVLARCRDGRPIKLEGNPGHPISDGGLCATGQATVLDVYDSQRFDGPRRAGTPATWDEADAALTTAFDGLRASGGRVRVLTGTVNSPSTRAAIARFVSGFADGRHVEYDSLSCASLLDAHEAAFGQRILPTIRFERARTIVSFDADFLATWISPVEFTRAYTRGRRLEGDAPRMSRHFQLEARMSLTGTCADERVRVAPWETAGVLAELCRVLEERAGVATRLAGTESAGPHAALAARLADELWSTPGESLVVAGANELSVQLLCCYANDLLGSYGSTLDLERPSHQRHGDDARLDELRAELEAGTVDALVIHGVNPAYDLAGGLALEGVGLVVAASGAPDETSARAHWVCPEPHALESWNDAEPRAGVYSLTQPTVPLLRAGRTLRASLSRWSGDAREDRELLLDHWRTSIFPRVPDATDFDAFFDRVLERGYVELAPPRTAVTKFDASRVAAPPPAPAIREGELGLVLYAKVGLLDGRHAHNPWLQELPDPVSKIAWDNYACLSPGTAARLGVHEGDVVRFGETDTLLPVHVQPGQHDAVVAVALGYGRAGTDRFADLGPDWIGAQPTTREGEVIGVRAVDLSGSFALAPTENRVELACTQDHHSLEVPTDIAPEGHAVRDIAPRATFAAWLADPGAALHGRHHSADRDLWPDDHAGPVRWGMAVDLARCTGCSACVIGCQAENNVPVVGKDEVRRHREMTWLRIDRYFQGDGDAVSTVHQPMMCQQCDHAPCESVCPVLATVHSSEGLNQQVYNRCVGTRYCANTCPYKVRRFNWFDYERTGELAEAVLNPDVTVRSRGVMEKCSFCVQRIQDVKAEAKREGRAVHDGDIQSACQQSCPAEAIVFGDLNDPESRASKLAAAPRAYGVLDELGVRPSVRYLARVHNGHPGDENGEENHGG